MPSTLLLQLIHLTKLYQLRSGYRFGWRLFLPACSRHQANNCPSSRTRAASSRPALRGIHTHNSSACIKPSEGFAPWCASAASNVARGTANARQTALRLCCSRNAAACRPSNSRSSLAPVCHSRAQVMLQAIATRHPPSGCTRSSTREGSYLHTDSMERLGEIGAFPSTPDA